MEFRSVGDMVVYFADLDRRVTSGQFNPTSAKYGDEVARLSASVETVRGMLSQGITNQSSDASELLYLASSLYMMTLLLGKIAGFDRGIHFLLDRAGRQGEYLV